MPSKKLVLAVTGAAVAAVPAFWLADAAAEAPAARPAQAEGAPEAPLVALGRRLFHDPAVSRGGRHSCASCHDPEHGWSDARRVSDDADGPTARHSQTVVDLGAKQGAKQGADLGERPGAADGVRGFHWDGEFPLPRDLVVARIGDADDARNAALARGLALAAKQRASGTGPSFGGGSYGSAPAFATASATVPETPVPIPARLSADARYAPAFAAAFGDAEITSARIVDAVDAFVGSLKTGRNALDRHLAGESGALSPAAARGLALFEGKAGCAACHTTQPGADGRAALTDHRFRNTGVAFAQPAAQAQTEVPVPAGRQVRLGRFGRVVRRNPVSATFAPAAQQQGDATNIAVSFRGGQTFRVRHGIAFPDGFDSGVTVGGFADPGRATRSGDAAETGAFKTASLRDIARRAPYMHDGSLATLEDVVRYYAKGGTANPHLDPAVKKLDLSDAEVADLVAFLSSLSADERAGLLPERAETRRVRLRVVNPLGNPLAGLEVEIVPAGERLGAKPLGAAWTVTTGPDGTLAFDFPQATHVLLRGDGLEIADDRPLPDTVGEMDVTAAASDRAFVVLRGADLPERLTGTLADLPGSSLHAAPGTAGFREFALPEAFAPRPGTPAETFAFERVKTIGPDAALYATMPWTTGRRALVRLEAAPDRVFAARVDLAGGMSEPADLQPVERIAVALPAAGTSGTK